MYSSNSKQWKKFDEVYCCVCKNIEKIEMFAKYFFNLDVVDHVYFLVSVFSLKRRLKNVTKVFMWEVVLIHLKFSEPIDAK